MIAGIWYGVFMILFGVLLQLITHVYKRDTPFWNALFFFSLVYAIAGVFYILALFMRP